ncbi:R.Pab1 family restriction endonuclease [Candidatus Omnitrophota bacterium]
MAQGLLTNNIAGTIMPNISSKIDYNSDHIRISLPITSPTGKIRVKRREGKYDVGFPFATRQNALDAHCYVEWQIGYDTPNPSLDGCVKEISFVRKGETKYGFELTSLLYNGIKNGIFDAGSVKELLYFSKSIDKQLLFEEKAIISRNMLEPFRMPSLDFHVIEEKYPLYYLDKKDYVIEVAIKHKQRAVGYQAMIYVCLPIGIFNEKIVGRAANQKELISFNVHNTENNFIYDAFRVFSMASKQHNHDIVNILTLISKKI